MTQDKATRRYLSFLIPATLVFLGASVGLKAADNADLIPPTALYAAAIVPIVAFLSMLWAHWRYMQEIDEFLRSIQIKAVFVALAVVLSVASGWGYLEFYAKAPALSVFWLNPIYWIAYSVASVLLSWRNGAAS